MANILEKEIIMIVPLFI